MRNALLIAAVIGLSLVQTKTTQASTVNIRGGGHCATLNGRTYLLDFVEHGNQMKPAFLSSTRLDFRALKKATWLRLPQLPGLSDDAIFKKVNDISELDPLLAISVLKTISFLDWALVDHQLIDVESDSIFPIKNCQLALRTAMQVNIDRALWNRLDDMNRLGLIFHEAISALQAPSFSSPIAARALTGYLFDADQSSFDPIKMSSYLDLFPSIHRLRDELGDARGPDVITLAFADVNGSEDLAFSPVTRVVYQYVESQTPSEEFHGPQFDMRGICDEPVAESLKSVTALYQIVELTPGEMHPSFEASRVNAHFNEKIAINLAWPKSSDVSTEFCSLNYGKLLSFMYKWSQQFSAFVIRTPTSP